MFSYSVKEAVSLVIISVGNYVNLVKDEENNNSLIYNASLNCYVEKINMILSSYVKMGMIVVMVDVAW